VRHRGVPVWDALASAVAACWGRRPSWAFAGGPWGLYDPDELARLFDAAGFTDAHIARRTLPVVFDGGPAQLVATLPAASVGPQVAALDDQGRASLLAAAEEALGRSWTTVASTPRRRATSSGRPGEVSSAGLRLGGGHQADLLEVGGQAPVIRVPAILPSRISSTDRQGMSTAFPVAGIPGKSPVWVQ